jgi:hypothetical protein
MILIVISVSNAHQAAKNAIFNKEQDTLCVLLVLMVIISLTMIVLIQVVQLANISVTIQFNVSTVQKIVVNVQVVIFVLNVLQAIL